MRQAFFLYPTVSSEVHSNLCVLDLPRVYLWLVLVVAESPSKYSTPLLISLIPQMPLLDPGQELHPPFDFCSLSNQVSFPNCL